MIPVFIASSERFKDVEWMAAYSLLSNTQSQISLNILRPSDCGMQESGCTGFTNFRWALPQILRESGFEFGVYLDVDMLVLGDIAELWGYRKKGKWVCLEDGSDEVSVICSSLIYPDKSVLHMRHKGTLPRGFHSPEIPLCWNSEDKITDGMKILHFTSLDNQPWKAVHYDPEVDQMYHTWRGMYESTLRHASAR